MPKKIKDESWRRSLRSRISIRIGVAFSDYVHEKWNEQFDEEYIAKQVELAIEATNEQRRKKGRTELVYDESLDELAEQRAHQIADNFTHTLPEGGTVSKYHLAENIAAHSYNDVEPGKFAVNWLWMNSFGHKTNILAKNATKINIKAVVVPDVRGGTGFNCLDLIKQFSHT